MRSTTEAIDHDKRMARMRRLTAVVIAATIIVPLGSFASPAGAVSGTNCNVFGGRITFAPRLPPFGNHARVISTITGTKLILEGCKGATATWGRVSFAVKTTTKLNCTTLGPAGFTAKGNATIKWSKGASSTITLTLTTPRLTNNANINAKITAGQFAGLTWTGTTQYGLDNGSCTTAPLGLASIQLAKGMKLVIS